MERSRLTLLAVALATFMTYLDNNIINVAITRVYIVMAVWIPWPSRPSSRICT